MTYKAIALDMDGTLLSTKNELETKTKDTLIRAQEAGLKIILASGRPTFGIMEAAKSLRLKEFGGCIVSYNGGKVIDLSTNELIHERGLTPKECHEIYDLSRRHKVGLMAYDGNNVITEDYDEHIETESRLNKIQINQIQDFKKAVVKNSPKCITTGNPEHLVKVEKEFIAKISDRFNIFRSMPYFLEITPKNVNKATSLEKALEFLNLNADELIACGDSYNDIEMIKFAGLGVAVDNAIDEIKEIADYITATNDENGVAKVVEKFILNS